MSIQGNDGKQFDLASVFPAKGDPRRPPEWFGRGLLYIVIAAFAAIFVWRSLGKLEYLAVDLVISVFIALAVEPLVLIMVKHGWKRGAASAVTLVGLVVVCIGLLAMFGNMFVQQVISLFRGLPDAYEQISAYVAANTTFRMPAIQNLGSEIINNIQTSWVTNFASQAAMTLGSIGGVLLDLMTVMLVTYYVSAGSPRMRRSMCQWLSPDSQRRFVLVWQVLQDQISNFLFSRGILAIINAVCTAVFLEILNVPYWLPLALFCGLTAQFVPTVGTYIGGALPVLFAWINGGLWYGVGVLVYIIVYQQIENLILSPKISQRTMDLNPAVAFLVVLALGSLFGALGAFLALPVAASFQAIFSVYTKRYELIDSPLLGDPKPLKKSKLVEGAEAFTEHVIHPMTDHMPRAAQGSSKRVMVEEELDALKRKAYSMPTAEDLDASETVAIPQRTDRGADGKGVKGLRGAENGGGDDGGADEASDEASDKASDAADNPRGGWR
ncbi:AI-2E family transporter [Bifidobacterium avesanii]|nr:AI-2E family transporter [Bifidobacterium avesanii]